MQNSRGDSYQKEVRVSYLMDESLSGITLEIHGRIDGIFLENDAVVIEEIKSTRQKLEELNPAENGIHFAQAKIYAFIYADQHKLEKIELHLTYYQLTEHQSKTFTREYTQIQLKEFFEDTVNRYLERTREIYNWKEVRDSTLLELSFPFSSYRQGQESFMEEVSQAVEFGYNLFVQAPTGLGKTLAALYPAIKALGQGCCSKIFYLTARTTTREAAQNALDLLRQTGLRLKSITLTAKEKVCCKPEKICDPEYCEFIAGYFDRLKDATRDIFSHDKFTRELIDDYAQKHKLCPFEFSLDLSLVSDCIICDYNYFFDPQVYLARYFSVPKQPFVFLVDEAHNLVERSRDMYSADLEKKEFLNLKRFVNKSDYPHLQAALEELNTYFLKMRKSLELKEEKLEMKKEISLELTDLLEDFREPAEALLSESQRFTFRDELTDLYYRVVFFLKIYDLAQKSDAYVAIYKQQGNNVRIKQLCLDASQMIRQMTDKGVSTVFFSATLSPPEYFFRLLGGNDDEDSVFQLASPFSPENLCLCIVDNISTKYRVRQYSYDIIAEYLFLYLRQRKGNYLLFFPSYQYLEEVFVRFKLLALDLDTMKQERSMTEPERDLFLAKFVADREKTLAGFVVMGGIFGESIDLPGERLSGAAVIGVGLPQVNRERDLIRQYFDHISGDGFHYAYTFPGMNRVLQAAGRIIRTEQDRGSLLLIDDRFSSTLYQKLYPKEWQNINIIRNKEQLIEVVREFWSE